MIRNFENRFVFKEYDAQKRYNGLGTEFGDVRDFRCESRVTECMTRLAIKDKHKDTTSKREGS
jgi:hypothetical protein